MTARPLGLSASRHTQHSTTEPTPQQTLMNKISIAEQLQFVYEECAVLLSVHGAGLTNTLGQRPGTAVIELLSVTGPSYQYLRNLAQLLPHVVDHNRVEHLNGTGRNNEKDLRYSDDKRFDQLHVLIEQKLQDICGSNYARNHYLAITVGYEGRDTA